MRGFIKTLILLCLALAVFGGGGYWAYTLFLKPEIELKRDRESPPAPSPVFQDGTVGEFKKCLEVEAAGDFLAARRAYEDFLQTYPDSTKAEEARFRLGAIRLGQLFAPRMAPGKEIYVVKSGDVLLKICHRLKVPPDLIMAMNQMESSALRVGQKLYWIPDEFTAVVDRVGSKVVVFAGSEFFAQVPILSTQGTAWVGTPPKKTSMAALDVKVFDKPGWKDGRRVSTSDKEYAEALLWVVFQPGGHTFYAEPGQDGGNVSRPTSGYGLDPAVVRALSALLRKGETVTIR